MIALSVEQTPCLALPGHPVISPTLPISSARSRWSSVRICTTAILLLQLLLLGGCCGDVSSWRQTACLLASAFYVLQIDLAPLNTCLQSICGFCSGYVRWQSLLYAREAVRRWTIATTGSLIINGRAASDTAKLCCCAGRDVGFFIAALGQKVCIPHTT